MDNKKDEVLKNLRSCLISCKGGIRLEALRRDYQVITGELLPFKQFGYSSVEAFVRSIPDVKVIKKWRIVCGSCAFQDDGASHKTGFATKDTTKNTTTAKKTPLLKTSDPRKELEIRANALNLQPPVYKMYSRKEKHSDKTTIYAIVEIGTLAHYTHTRRTQRTFSFSSVTVLKDDEPSVVPPSSPSSPSPSPSPSTRMH